MTPLCEPQWRERYQAACDSYEALRRLAAAPVDRDIDTGAAMLEWARNLQALDLAGQDGDPAFAEPLLRELLAMNGELVRLFSARRDATAQAHRQQKKVHQGIDAYRSI